ncbi:aspartokinase/homoserine dehydrogenase 1 [Natronospira proteinivora]|uniref:homoserine dehydrogenase n=1 Tax=Natronospira proteinivora TaxID=1807133 RepID=A0ABT1GBP5_9GAMM|nr:hypothetical protein [Natronospira proteinivora]MCP1727788.1 aspartokinase/homoserine dehydrogenase 1 [Natronospira proteinivora]
MSSVRQQPSVTVLDRSARDSRSICPLVVIGSGNVGGELLQLLDDRRPGSVSLLGLANSRTMLWNELGLSLDGIRQQLAESDQASCLDELASRLLDQGPQGVIVDLTASREVADRHAGWIQAGLDVVTANKWAAAGEAQGYQALLGAEEAGVGRYRHATTVGAGLPLLDSLQRLRSAGESIVSVSGLFSGTLSYLMQGLQSGRGLAKSLWAAHEQGLTEPDPRLDLSGLDVARKLVITARAAGFELSLEDVRIESLVPPSLIDCDLSTFFAQGSEPLDSHWAGIQSKAEAGIPRYVGQVDNQGQASVGIQWLPTAHPFVGVGATDNIFEIRSDSYRDTPLIIRGPGAGSRVTAVQVLADIHSLI